MDDNFTIVYIILLILAGISFIVAAGFAFRRPPLVNLAVGFTAIGLLLWVVVPLVEYIRVA